MIKVACLVTLLPPVAACHSDILWVQYFLQTTFLKLTPLNPRCQSSNFQCPF